MPNLLEKLKPARHIVTKYNEAEFNHFFDGLIAQTDKVIAAQKQKGYVSEDGGYVPDWKENANEAE